MLKKTKKKNIFHTDQLLTSQKVSILYVLMLFKGLRLALVFLSPVLRDILWTTQFVSCISVLFFVFILMCPIKPIK